MNAKQLIESRLCEAQSDELFDKTHSMLNGAMGHLVALVNLLANKDQTELQDRIRKVLVQVQKMHKDVMAISRDFPGDV